MVTSLLKGNAVMEKIYYNFWYQETQNARGSPCNILTYLLQNKLKSFMFYTVTMGCADLQETTFSHKPRHKSEEGL